MSRALVVDLGGARRCLSSAVLGGGLHIATHWLNVQVPHDYSRLDPEAHLAGEALARGLRPESVVGMLTAADVDAVQLRARGPARVRATVGIGHPLAAAGRIPGALPMVGTINLLVELDSPLTDSALAGAIQTATEAKAQGLADAGVRALNHPGYATGTATDSICVAALPGASEPFAGPATAVGGAVAATVHGAVLAGARADELRTARSRRGGAARSRRAGAARWRRAGAAT